MTRVTYRTVEEMVRRDASFAPTFEIEPFLKQDHRGAYTLSEASLSLISQRVLSSGRLTDHTKPVEDS